ncbi:MAG: D-sedoheptulose 7-phosphate isomerase [bacterium]
MEEKVLAQLNESAKIKLKLDTKQIVVAAQLIIEAYQKGGKVLLMGNGGSAADAQHIAGELVGRFKKERKALPAIALTTDTSILTAIGNDYNFDEIFRRQVEALAQQGDIVIGITTSGTSPNVLLGIEKANEIGAKTIGLSGRDGGKLRQIANLCLIVPSNNTPRIQEAHITIGHIICDLVEETLFR